MDHDLFGNPINKPPELGEGKTCIACSEYKFFSEFSKHIGHKDNHDGRCRSCINEQVHLRNTLKRQAPTKPDFCICCGNKSVDIVLDHCHETKEFRGWICRFCNAGIGLLGDDINGVTKALQYLRRHYDKGV
mgnify:CR=1 FL=1|tara:strand:+ start:676 stop:1071 length:396 start_codon:yes stop_codon:yes gene_type:complete